MNAAQIKALKKGDEIYSLYISTTGAVRLVTHKVTSAGPKTFSLEPSLIGGVRFSPQQLQRDGESPTLRNALFYYRKDALKAAIPLLTDEISKAAKRAQELTAALTYVMEQLTEDE